MSWGRGAAAAAAAAASAACAAAACAPGFIHGLIPCLLPARCPSHTFCCSAPPSPGLSTDYCDDFECTSSPAVEASVRTLAKDLQRANGRWTPIYASNVEYSVRRPRPLHAALRGGSPGRGGGALERRAERAPALHTPFGAALASNSTCLYQLSSAP